jgi:hypothetical protein
LTKNAAPSYDGYFDGLRSDDYRFGTSTCLGLVRRREQGVGEEQTQAQAMRVRDDASAV